MRIPLGDIREAEVSLGRRSAAGQGVTGFVVGAVAAGGGMAIACALTADCPVALLTVGAGGLGGLLGAAVGASRGTDSSRECWRTITSELRGWLSGEAVDAPPRRSLSPFARRAEPVARPATRCD